MEEKIEIKKIENAFVVAIKIENTWVAKVGDSKMIAEAFGVGQVEESNDTCRIPRVSFTG